MRYGVLCFQVLWFDAVVWCLCGAGGLFLVDGVLVWCVVLWRGVERCGVV